MKIGFFAVMVTLTALGFGIAPWFSTDPEYDTTLKIVTNAGTLGVWTFIMALMFYD